MCGVHVETVSVPKDLILRTEFSCIVLKTFERIMLNGNMLTLGNQPGLRSLLILYCLSCLLAKPLSHCEKIC